MHYSHRRDLVLMLTTAFALLVLSLFTMSAHASGSQAPKAPRALPEIGVLSDVLPAQPANDPTCQQDPQDPFEPAYRINEAGGSPNQGQCVDTKVERHVVVVRDGDDARFPARAGVVFVANVWHTDGYYVAEIPFEGVTDILYQDDNNHSFMRFDFAKGVRLHPQSRAALGAPTLVVRQLFWSYEAAPPVGKLFEPVGGMAGKYQAQGRLMTMARAVGMSKSKRRTRQIRFIMSPEQKQATLVAALVDSHLIGFNKRFWLGNDNCANNTFRILDQALWPTYSRARRLQVRAHGLGGQPGLMAPGFALRGIYDIERSSYPSLAEELERNPTVADATVAN